MKRTIVLLAAILAGICCLLTAADEIPRKIQIAKTEHSDLAAHGTLTLKNSTGELTIEGWDQSGVEITTIKSTKLAYPSSGAEREKGALTLDEVKVSTTHQGDELIVTTEFPRHRRYLPRPSVGARDFDLEYRIRVPRDTKIVVDHDAGEIHLDDLAGDIRATTKQGEITLRLPSSGQYAIDAKSRIGDVDSDFAGTTTRRYLGHAFVQPSQASHSLYLRNGCGDIIILRSHQAKLTAR